MDDSKAHEVEALFHQRMKSLRIPGAALGLLTAALVMQLVDDGLVDLEAPASVYLPGLQFGRGCTGKQRTTTVR